jgi:integrase
MFELLFEPMASIFRKPTKDHTSLLPFWFAAYRDARGQRKQRSTKLADKKAALRLANEWERLASAGRNGLLTEAACRKALAELHEQCTGEPLQFHTCRAWLDEWIAGKKGSTAHSTFQKYEQTTRDFLTHLGDRAELALGAISPRDIRSFRDALAKGGRAPSTVNMAIRKTLSAPFSAAQRLGYIPMNPCNAVEPLRDDAEASRETFTAAQVSALLAAAEGDWKGAILCGYTTGLRLRDISEMKWEAIDLDAGLLRIKTRKTGAPLVLPIHADLAHWLRAQPRGIAKAPVFPELSGKGTGGRFGLSGRFKTIMETAKIKSQTLRDGEGAGRTTASLTFHSLRHTFISALANAGVASDLRQRLSGHSDDKTHQGYTHHDDAIMRAAIGSLPKVGGKSK